MKNKLGIIGGGQLGRMLGMSAKQLGFHVTVIDETPDGPAAQVVDAQIVANVKDEAAIRQLAKSVDYLTFEVELANAAILEELEKSLPINPSAKTLTLIKDKFLQKQFLEKNTISTAKSCAVENETDIVQAAKKYGFPLLLKARFDAYDGRGNALIRKTADIPGAMKKLAGRKLYVEQYVSFTKELAVMVARSTSGEIKTYPVVETIHKNNICHTVLAPAPVSGLIRKKTERLAIKVMKHLQGAGVFGIEMFLTNNGKVLVNEIAPRVHNSGHYTLEACVTSQFEQHIRAVTGLPLGSTKMLVPAAVMVNILGERSAEAEVTGFDRALNIPGVSVHIYQKKDTKPERKMGHLTAVDSTIDKAYKKARLARKYISI